MSYLVKQGGKTDYNYKEYMCDTASDIANININECSPGSVAYVIATGDVYMLNNERTWVIQ